MVQGFLFVCFSFLKHNFCCSFQLVNSFSLCFKAVNLISSNNCFLVSYLGFLAMINTKRGKHWYGVQCMEFLVILIGVCDIPSTWYLVLVFNVHHLHMILLIADSHKTYGRWPNALLKSFIIYVVGQWFIWSFEITVFGMISHLFCSWAPGVKNTCF